MSAAAGHNVAGQDTDRQKEEDFLKACKYGDVASVKALIDANVNVNASDRFEPGCSALEYAASGGHLKIVNSLIEAGVDINRTHYDGDDTVGAKTLVAGALCGHLDCLTRLVTAGVDVTQKDKDFVTVGGKALVEAAFYGKSDFVKALIEAGVDLNQNVKLSVIARDRTIGGQIKSNYSYMRQDKDGETVGGNALVQAAYKGTSNYVKVIVDAGVDANQMVKFSLIARDKTIGGQIKSNDSYMRQDMQPDPNEKPSHFYLGRISRRIPAKEFHHLFTELGLSQNYIDKIKTEHTSTKQCIFVLLLEWARHPGSTYKQLADALYKKQRYVLDIEEIQTNNCGWTAGREATLVRNNIQLEQVDVIACAVDSSLNFETSGKTARDLLTFGGKTLQSECKERFPSGIKVEDVIAINGGKLKCKKVYLTSLPDGETEDEESHKKYNKHSEKLSKRENDKITALRTTIGEMLNKAAKEQMKSIALPAIGTSKLGLAPDKVANIMYGCIKRLPKGPLRDVRFVLNDKATYKAFEKEHLLVKDIPDTFLNKNVEDSTDLELDRVCIMTGSSYLELGLELGLTKPEVDALKKDYRKCLSITREVIKLWINKNRPNATWEVLGDALYEIGADMDFITSMYTESRDTPQ